MLYSGWCAIGRRIGEGVVGSGAREKGTVA